MSKIQNSYSWVCLDATQIHMVLQMADNMTWTNTSCTSDPHTLFYLAYNQVICYNPKSAHDYSVYYVEETAFPFFYLMLSHNSILNYTTLKISWVVTHY